MLDHSKAPASLVEVSGARRHAGADVAVFCDRCGYALNGLPMRRCEQCDVLQFTCPECGHHQAINSQALAVQRLNSWLRLVLLVGLVLVKVNVFGWGLFVFFIVGNELSRPPYGGYYNESTFLGMPSDTALGLLLFSVAFGGVARLLLLRWGRTVPVVLGIGALVAAAGLLGALMREWERPGDQRIFESLLPIVLWWTGTWSALGALFAWPVWVAVVRLLLPSKAAGQLLAWQRSLSQKVVTPG